MITAENIAKTYHTVHALNNISFDVQKGEVFGFIGPDGAGKTTLFRIIASLVIPDAGKASVAGFDVVKNYRNIRAITGYMPGKFSLYSDLSVEENIGFFASVFGTSLKANYQLIHDIYIQLEPFKDRLAGKLSGGMKQKLALCCALIHRPELLILDEPTTGVDAVSRKEFWELLGSLKSNGITVLVSTPYMDEAQLCDRVALIQDGSLLKIDKPAGITGSYAKTFYSFRSEDNYRLISDIRTLPIIKNAFAFGQSIHCTGEISISEIDNLKKLLEAKGHKHVQIEIIEPGIEDVFIDLMQKETQTT